MLTVYTLLIRLAVPLMLIRLLWRSRQNPDYRKHLGRRLALGLSTPKPSPAPRIWVHAVSVGETLAVAPLIERILAEHPRRSILVTSTTPTGADQVRRLFGDRVEHSWVPFDTPGCVDRFLQHWQPGVVALVETEIWPHIILQSQRRGIPSILLNARLSERSARRYARVATLAKPVLHGLTHICCQQATDARRFQTLGVSPQRLSVTGSLKFDISLDALIQQRDVLERELNLAGARPLWVAASTHEGEEQLVLRTLGDLKQQAPNILLVLAPRHPERADILEQQAVAAGYTVLRRTAETAVGASTDILLLDTLGELGALTGLATQVFIGGSLVDRGGHNPLEAAAFGVPVVVGPNTFNFSGIYSALERRGAVIRVADGNELRSAVVRLAVDETHRQQVGVAGQQYFEENRGALDRQYTRLVATLESV